MISRNKETVVVSLSVSFLVSVAVGIIVLTVFLGRESAPVSGGLQFPAHRFQSDIGEEQRVVEIVEAVNPAVLSIVVTKDVPVVEQYFEQGNPFFDDFFGEDFPFNVPTPRYRERGTERREVGGGSGFIVSPDGLVVTNKHVVADEEASYTAFTKDGTKYEIERVAVDPFFDIAIMRLKGGKNFPYLTFGDSEKLRLGQSVIAIGNALAEFHNSVSVGVVSGLSRSVVAGGLGDRELLEEVVQTDAAINPGNSGGPLLDLRGKVVGVNVAVAMGSENIGFALPSNVVASVVESVKKEGKIVRPYIGVRYTAVTKSLKEKNNLSVDYGVLVLHGEDKDELAVVPGSPADKAGIVENDIILEVDGVKIDEDHSLGSLIRRKSVGEAVRLKILHRGKEKIVDALLEGAPDGL